MMMMMIEGDDGLLAEFAELVYLCSQCCCPPPLFGWFGLVGCVGSVDDVQKAAAWVCWLDVLWLMWQPAGVKNLEIWLGYPDTNQQMCLLCLVLDF